VRCPPGVRVVVRLIGFTAKSNPGTVNEVMQMPRYAQSEKKPAEKAAARLTTCLFAKLAGEAISEQTLYNWRKQSPRPEEACCARKIKS